MRNLKYYKCIFAASLLVLITAVLASCSNELFEDAQKPEVFRMRLEGGFQEFDAVATRATSSLPNGAKLLIRFDGGAYGTGVYSAETGDWEFTKTGGSLSSTSSASCTLYYAPSPKSEGINTITLDYDTPLYLAQGEYSYTASLLTIKATLKPATVRVRFKGTSGTTISLSGLTYYTGVDVSKSSPLSSTASSISLKVNGTYTDYVYGYFADSNRALELTTNSVTYKRTIESNVFEIGESGSMDIPTSSAQGSWKDTSTHEYVDLGLSVMWATCNVGANSPEEYGDYYAWGETEPKSVYNWSTYKWCKGTENTLTKYCTSSSYGTVDNKTTLDPEDDVAHVKWGGDWRMPTYKELKELFMNCNCTMTTQGGKNGYMVTSMKNGNSIFLPATDLTYTGTGNYWSSSLDDKDNDACGIFIDEDYWITSINLRCSGLSIRAVCPNPSLVGSITLNRNSLEISTGETFQLTATVSPNSALNKDVTWASSNDAVATVSNTGLVTAVATGSVTITATANDGSGVTATCSVTVSNPSNAHEYVDLGLSVKWATCNIGASSPEEYGDYYAWGETETKSFYDWSTDKWCNGSSYTMTKYCTSSSYGTVDNKTQLDPADDVAHVKWGGSWRMPTKAEQDELRENCTWKWTTQGGKNGYKVTSKKNGNSIFLPAAGYRYDSGLSKAGSDGYYWSSSLNPDYGYGAYFLGFDSGYWLWNNGDRYVGHSVRAVCP